MSEAKLYHWRLSIKELWLAETATAGPALYSPNSHIAFAHRELETALGFLLDEDKERAELTKSRRSADNTDEWPCVVSVRLSDEDFGLVCENLQEMKGVWAGWQSEAARGALRQLRAARLELINSEKV